MKNILLFFKRNAVYLIVAFCILAIGLTITLIAINKGDDKTINNIASVKDIDTEYTSTSDTEGTTQVDNKENNTTPVSEPVEEVIVFSMPVANFTSVEDYTDKLYFNTTLGRFQSHKAIDFFAEEGTQVLAVFNGKVESVTNGILEGYTVVIDHGNGLKSIYNSLQDGDNVSVGDVVKKGDVIGEVSTSNRQEYKEGAHLHFSVQKDGALINPEEYLMMDNK